MPKSVAFTLFEGDYEYGVGAWVNSLLDNGFTGRIVIGYRQSLPFWVSRLVKKNYDTYIIKSYPQVEVEFREINFNFHLRYYKPFFFELLLEEYPESNIYYFDPDITVIGDWQFFEEWVGYGIALVLDESYPIMPYNHPLKHKWAQLFNYRISKSNCFDYYINSGFIGCNSSGAKLIREWKNNIELLAKAGANLKEFKPAIMVSSKLKRLNPITGDQDIINATICQYFNELKLSIVGPEGMGFIPSGYIMLHNTGKKTWRKNFIVEFLSLGSKASIVDVSYLKYCLKPVQLYTQRKFWMKKMNLKLTKILQRIF